MTKGDIILANVPTSDGGVKLRPALFIKAFPPYNDVLICGISSQLQQHIEGFTFLISDQAEYFRSTGLIKSSVVRINYLAMIANEEIAGKIGFLPQQQ